MSLQLDARQRAILAEMGLRAWARPAPTLTPPATESGAASARPDSVSGQFGPKSEAETVVARAAAPTRAPDVALAPTPPAAPAVMPPPARATPARATPTAPAADDGPCLAPRPEGVETMDWTALAAAVANCRACGLCSGRTQTVFGVGDQRADWMVIGEAPGEHEDRQGEPFVGQAGKLLDNMLAAIGLSRHTQSAPESEAASARSEPDSGTFGLKNGVYIANVLKCRPPANRNPLPSEIAQCEPYLRRQVALVQPKIILAMGRFAVQALLNTQEPIGRLRGRVHHYEGIPVIVTYHPAYLLRALPEKAKAWQDLCLALEVKGADPPA